MKPLDTQAKTAASESGVTLEAIISIGVLGWLAMGMVLMGLGIWESDATYQCLCLLERPVCSPSPAIAPYEDTATQSIIC